MDGNPENDPEVSKNIDDLRQTKTGGHAGEVETSMLLSHRPDLVHVDSGKNQSGQSVSEPYKCN